MDTGRSRDLLHAKCLHRGMLPLVELHGEVPRVVVFYCRNDSLDKL